MTIAATPAHRRVDLSQLVLALLALVLCGLVLLPLGWLLWYGLTDKAGALTIANLTRIFSERGFVSPFVTSLGIAAAVAVAWCALAPPPALAAARTPPPPHRPGRPPRRRAFVPPASPRRPAVGRRGA